LNERIYVGVFFDGMKRTARTEIFEEALRDKEEIMGRASGHASPMKMSHRRRVNEYPFDILMYQVTRVPRIHVESTRASIVWAT
jgi:hypothetical protein